MPDPEIRELSPQPAVRPPRGARGRALRPPYNRYLRTGEELELELGIPVGPDAEQSSGLPGGQAAVLRHVGPFSGLRAACAALEAWVVGQGEEPAGPFWESYVTNPRDEPDSSQWVTEIVQPI